MTSLNKDKPNGNSGRAHFGEVASEAASAILNEGQKLAHELYDDGLKKAKEARSEINDYSEELLVKVRENPLKAVLIAGGIGFLLSALLKK